MKTKELTTSAIFLALGTIFHYIIPGIVGGMKPDFLLLMMFMAILINFNFKNALAVSVLGGIIAALTTTFPGGQIPSILDKLVSGIFVYLIAYLVSKYSSLNSIVVILIAFFGTLISGSIFIGSATLIAGLPEGVTFSAMFFAVVLPTAIFTGFLSGFLYGILSKINRLRD